MRVVDFDTSRKSISNIQRLNTKINDLRMDISTEQRVRKLSDDPPAMLRGLTALGDLERNKQFVKNVDHLDAYSNQTDISIGSMEETVIKIRSMAVADHTKIVNPEDRKHIALQLDSYMETIISEANQKYEGSYMFAGTKVDTNPFTVKYKTITEGKFIDYVNYIGNSDDLKKEISDNLFVKYNVTGTDIMKTGEEEFFQINQDVLKNLENDLSTTQLDQLKTIIDKKYSTSAGLSADLTPLGFTAAEIAIIQNHSGVNADYNIFETLISLRDNLLNGSLTSTRSVNMPGQPVVDSTAAISGQLGRFVITPDGALPAATQPLNPPITPPNTGRFTVNGVAVDWNTGQSIDTILQNIVTTTGTGVKSATFDATRQKIILVPEDVDTPITIDDVQGNFSAFSELRNSPNVNHNFLNAIDKIQQNLLTLRTQTGIIGQKVEDARSNLTNEQSNFETVIKDEIGADLPKSIVEMMANEKTLQGALSVTAKMNQLSLMDFLR